MNPCNQKSNGVAPYIYQLSSKSEVSIFSYVFSIGTLQYESRTSQKATTNQSTHYEKYRQFLIRKGSHHVLPPNQYFSLSAK